MRRPEPRGAEDIGTWYSIMEIMASCSVVTNGLIVCFTSVRFCSFVGDDGVVVEGSALRKVITFVLIEHAVFAIKILFGLLVEDVPSDVIMQLDRQDFLVSKLIMLEEDDNDDDLLSGAELDTDLTIHNSFQLKPSQSVV
jgi:anoctamin-10/anoctamin-7